MLTEMPPLSVIHRNTTEIKHQDTSSTQNTTNGAIHFLLQATSRKLVELTAAARL